MSHGKLLSFFNYISMIPCHFNNKYNIMNYKLYLMHAQYTNSKDVPIPLHHGIQCILILLILDKYIKKKKISISNTLTN